MYEGRYKYIHKYIYKYIITTLKRLDIMSVSIKYSGLPINTEANFH